MAETGSPLSPMRPGLGSAIFIAVMLAASLTTMLRAIVVAWFLPTADFAAYASIIATGAFLASVISFGAVESTIKAFPRLVAAGHQDELLGRAHQFLRHLALRAMVIGIPLFAAGELAELSWLRLIGVACVVAFSTAYTAIMASMQRAAGNSISLASGTILRTIGVFAAVSIAAVLGNLLAVIAAEVVATALTCFISERLYFARRPHVEPVGSISRPAVSAGESRRDGLRLFFAYTLVSVPFYLDRLYVVEVMGPSSGARYAILALFLTAASLLVNTVAQRAGPDAIKLVHQGNAQAASRHILLWGGISCTVWLVAMTLGAAVIAAGLLPPALARYGVELTMLAPIAVSGLLLCTGLLEFLLIALDREVQFVRAALVFAVSVAAAALTVAWAGWGLFELMWLLAGCRLAYGLALLLALPLRGNANRSRADERDPQTSESCGLFRAGFPRG